MHEVRILASNDSSRATWMADNMAILADRSLSQICLPGSHDTGMFQANDCRNGADALNTQTQKASMAGQLALGVRYFDIRVGIASDGTLQTCHYSLSAGLWLGCWGATLSSILSDVADFVGSHVELVVLKLSHFWPDPGDTASSSNAVQLTVSAVSLALGPYLFDKSTSGQTDRLSLIPLKYFLPADATKGTVLVLADKAGLVLDMPANIYAFGTDLTLWDDSSGTTDTTKMAGDQLGYLTDPTAREQDLVLLSWTLTMSPLDSGLTSYLPTVGAVAVAETLSTVAPPIAILAGALAIAFAITLAATPTLLDITNGAKSVLATSLSSFIAKNGVSETTIPNIVYCDGIDGRETDVALMVNQSYGEGPANIPKTNDNYVPQGGHGGLERLYASAEVVLIPSGTTLIGFAFILDGNQICCQLTVTDGNTSYPVKGKSGGAYIHKGNTRGLSSIYANLNPTVVPVGKVLLGIGLQQGGAGEATNQMSLAAWCGNADGTGGAWVVPVSNDNYYPQGGHGGLAHSYLDTNGINIPLGQTVAALSMFVVGNQLVPALFLAPPPA